MVAAPLEVPYFPAVTALVTTGGAVATPTPTSLPTESTSEVRRLREHGIDRVSTGSFRLPSLQKSEATDDSSEGAADEMNDLEDGILTRVPVLLSQVSSRVRAFGMELEPPSSLLRQFDRIQGIGIVVTDAPCSTEAAASCADPKSGTLRTELRGLAMAWSVDMYVTRDRSAIVPLPQCQPCLPLSPSATFYPSREAAWSMVWLVL